MKQPYIPEEKKRRRRLRRARRRVEILGALSMRKQRHLEHLTYLRLLRDGGHTLKRNARGAQAKHRKQERAHEIHAD